MDELTLTSDVNTLSPQAAIGVAVEDADPAAPVPVAELVRLCAFDSALYCHTFFPSTFPMRTPAFHRDIDNLLDNPKNRYCAVEVFRGGAKTTKLRAYASKRIAYGISRTIMIISSSQDHAKRSVLWLRKQVMHNRPWAQTYGLSAGTKWTDEFIEIKHEQLGFTISIIAVGITGQTRGVNIDDHRPDLIIVDDPDNPETTSTEDQRRKTREAFFGDIEKSLVPETENPEAKMVLLQTSLHKEDLINRCHQDAEWRTLKFGCFDEAGNSRWEDRFPTETLRKSKAAHIKRGDTLLWLREMEATVGDEETAYFKRDWIRYWDTLPEKMVVVLGVDPAPPPSEKQLAKGLQDKDFEVLSVWGYSKGRVYLLEFAASRGHDPEWTIATFFRLRRTWKPLKARIEGNAYQKTLKWILEEAMKQRHEYIEINAEASTIPKHHRIRQAYAGIASVGNLYIPENATDFVEQFVAYPKAKHDDILDSGALALELLLELAPNFSDSDFDDPQDVEPSNYEWRSAP